MSRSYFITAMFVALFIGFSCSRQHMIDLQVEELAEDIFDVRASNIYEVARLLKQIEAIDDDNARVLALYYRTHLECMKNLDGCGKKMRDIYPLIKQHGFEDLVYEIDFHYARYQPGTEDEKETLQNLQYLEHPSKAFEKELYTIKIANYFDHRRFEKSENLYRSFIEKYAHRRDNEYFNILKNQYVQGLIPTGRYEEARKWAQDMLVDPSSTLLAICAYHRLAEIAFRMDGSLEYAFPYFKKMDKLLIENNFTYYYYYFLHLRAKLYYEASLYEESINLIDTVIENGPFTSDIMQQMHLQCALNMMKLPHFEREDILYHFDYAERFASDNQLSYNHILRTKINWLEAFDQNKADSLKLVLKDILLSENDNSVKMSKTKLNVFLSHHYTNQKLEQLQAQKKINTIILRNKKYIWALTGLSCLLGLMLFISFRKSKKNISRLQHQELELETLNTILTDKNKLLSTQNRHKNRVLSNLKNNNQHLFRFASVAANRINTPLKTIEKNAEHLYKHYRKRVDSEDYELFDFVLSSCSNLQNMISGLLQFSKITSMSQKPMEPVDLNILVANVINMLNSSLSEKNGQILVAAEMPVVTGYSSLIEQLFLNLLSNAIKFTDDGVAPNIEISYSYDGDWVQVSIKDNGVGIPEKFHGELFQFFRRFHKSKFAGSGIGLATCKKIVDMHEGDIWVTSNKNQGSTFSFTLPKKLEILSSHYLTS